jgi:hypothetical protein
VGLSLGGLLELAAELPVQQVQEGLFDLCQPALLRGYDLFESLAVIGYHGAFRVVVYDPRAYVGGPGE